MKSIIKTDFSRAFINWKFPLAILLMFLVWDLNSKRFGLREDVLFYFINVWGRSITYLMAILISTIPFLSAHIEEKENHFLRYAILRTGVWKYVCSSAAHWKLLQNWLETISGKYFSLDCRLELLCCKSLRGRICLWLLEQRDQTGSDTFTITMTRAELAAYLNCDRSALSRELSRMQEDGLIELFRSTFKLLDPERLANEM